MPLITLDDLPDAIPAYTRLMGLDVGEKTIGLALSDTGQMIATPSVTLMRSKFRKDVEELKAEIDEHGVKTLVIGLPLNMDGSEGPRCQSTRQFVKNLEPHLALPVLLWDERMSTMAVTRTLLEADMSRQKRAKVVDKMAAAYILQGALDHLNARRNKG